jgi:hypothetical protein
MPYRPSTLDPETDGILDDYCEASGDENKTKIIQKAIQLYILRNLGRNEGATERYVDLRTKRARQSGDAASIPSTGAKPDGEPPP